MDNQVSGKSSKSPIVKYIFSKKFWINLAAILGVFFIVFLIMYFWLKIYTNHGQALVLADYVEFNVTEARQSAVKNHYKLVVKDSIHVVGKAGGIILNQNPEPGSKVKEGRTIYVTITKSQADEIPLSRLPNLYGENFDRKKKELESHFEIRSKVIGKEYDPGVPGQILKVKYLGETIIDETPRDLKVMIEKGATLEFIISERTGGQVKIPDLVCEEYAAAKFILESIGLSIGDITYTGQVDNLETSIVVSQSPRSSDGRIERGSAISVEVSGFSEGCE